MGSGYECKDGSCSNMGGACANGQCDSGGCRNGSCESHGMNCRCEKCMGGESMDPMSMMKELKMEAYSELMVEKMKAAFERKIGKKMDKVVEVVVDNAIKHWASKMERKEMKMKDMEEYQQKLMDALRSK